MEAIIGGIAVELVDLAGEYIHGLDYKHLSPATVVSRFVSAFGVTPRHCAHVWIFCGDRSYSSDINRQKVHLLWTLNLLKTGDTEHALHGRWGADEKTIRKLTRLFMTVLSDLNVVRK